MTIIETADGEERMQSSHKCIKTYFVLNRMGDPVPISVLALFMRGLPQDLIGGKAINKINIRVILDDDPDICGRYPLKKEKKQLHQESIEFISKHTDLFYLQTKEMDWTDLMQQPVMKYGTNDFGSCLFGILSRPFNFQLFWKD